ncbi:MAG: TfoX/Sxy family protein [Alphaproteobacteria bacterium]|nr:TfoX/Sxy family protein [Alphaproteobacteria bacterium]
MAFDPVLAERLRDHFAGRAEVTEKKMFGGVAFMVRGNMCVGVVKDDLCARVGPERFDEHLARPGARVMDFTKRPMKGWLFVSGDAVAEDDALAAWVGRCEDFVRTLPGK